MAHQVNDVVELSFRGMCEGQTILNIFHVTPISSTSQNSDIADNASLAQWYGSQTGAGQILESWRNVMALNYVLQRIRAQKIYPNRSLYAEQVVGMNGLYPDQSDQTAGCAVFIKQGISGTRRAQGRMHVGPLPATAASLGFLDGGYFTQLDTFKVQWSVQFTVPTNNISYRPIIYNPGLVPPFQQIANTIVQDTVRTMRRRVVGRGI